MENSTQVQAIFDNAMKNSDAITALFDFIVNVYPKRNMRFSTSWTTYAICPTTEESLLHEAFCALQDKNPDTTDSSELDVDYVRDIPSMLICLAQHRATKRSHVDAIIAFSRDAIEDLMSCHLNEFDLDLEEDAEESASTNNALLDAANEALALQAPV